MATIRERFESKFVKGDGCWNWTADKSKKGYGRLRVGRKRMFAHRVSWALQNGDIPDGLCVLHRCDNPSCVRPDHLFIGTNADNVHDRENKGRGADHSGENNGHAILTREQVKEIREKRSNGARNVDLANEYGMSQGAISNIVCGRKWV